MVDIAAIAGVMNSLKIAIDLTNGAVASRDAKLISKALEEIRAKLIETQMAVLELQSTISALLDSERELKRKLAEFEEWALEKKKYDLVQLPGGAFAYASNGLPGSAGPAHYACPTCFHQKQISILQPRQWAHRLPALECPVCELSLHSGEEP